MYSFGHIAILDFGSLMPFLVGFGHVSQNDVSHRFNPQNDHHLAEPRHMSNKA